MFLILDILYACPKLNLVFIYRLTGECVTQNKNKKYTILVYGHVDIIMAISKSQNKNSHQLISGRFSRRLCPSISRNDPHYHHVNFFLNGCGSYFVFNGFIPKVNQIIRNTSRTSIPNLNAVEPTVDKLSCPQVF